MSDLLTTAPELNWTSIAPARDLLVCCSCPVISGWRRKTSHGSYYRTKHQISRVLHPFNELDRPQRPWPFKEQYNKPNKKCFVVHMRPSPLKMTITFTNDEIQSIFNVVFLWWKAGFVGLNWQPLYQNPIFLGLMETPQHIVACVRLEATDHVTENSFWGAKKPPKGEVVLSICKNCAVKGKSIGITADNHSNSSLPISAEE